MRKTWDKQWGEALPPPTPPCCHLPGNKKGRCFLTSLFKRGIIGISCGVVASLILQSLAILSTAVDEVHLKSIYYLQQCLLFFSFIFAELKVKLILLAKQLITELIIVHKKQGLKEVKKKHCNLCQIVAKMAWCFHCQWQQFLLEIHPCWDLEQSQRNRQNQGNFWKELHGLFLEIGLKHCSVRNTWLKRPSWSPVLSLCFALSRHL